MTYNIFSKIIYIYFIYIMRLTHKNSNRILKTKRTRSRTHKLKKYGGAPCKTCTYTEIRTTVNTVLSDFISNYKEVDFIKIQQLYLTMEYICNVQTLAALVVIKDYKLMHFIPFISNNDKTSVKTLMVDWLMKQDKLQKDLGLSLDKYNKFLETQKQPTTSLEENQSIILDRCMVYGTKNSNKDYFDDFKYYHISLYEDMFKNYCISNKIVKDRIFFINMFDHPIILKPVLNTNFLLSNDTINTKYSDISFPYADVWLRHTTMDMSKGNHYSSIKNEIDNFINITDDALKSNFESRKNKMVFRGSLTGCYPTNKLINSRLKYYDEYKSLIQKDPESEKYLDIHITGTFKGVIINNLLYDSQSGPGSINDQDYSEVFDQNEIQFAKYFLPMQSLFFGYQYILSLDGYVSAWRLPYELLFGNIIFIHTEYDSWIKRFLVHGENCFFIKSLEEAYNILLELEKDPSKKNHISSKACSLGKKLLDKNTLFEGITNSLQSVEDISINVHKEHIYG